MDSRISNKSPDLFSRISVAGSFENVQHVVVALYTNFRIEQPDDL